MEKSKPKTQTMLLAVRPRFCEEIFAGRKIFEYRKVRCRPGVGRILIYETAPAKMVVGEAKIAGVLAGPPEEIWKQTRHGAGIDKKTFDDYFRGADKAVAYKLDEVVEHARPKPLSAYGIRRAPQSFMYIR